MRRNGLAQTEQETVDSTANELKGLFQKRGKLIIELKNNFQNIFAPGQGQVLIFHW